MIRKNPITLPTSIGWPLIDDLTHLQQNARLGKENEVHQELGALRTKGAFITMASQSSLFKPVFCQTWSSRAQTVSSLCQRQPSAGSVVVAPKPASPGHEPFPPSENGPLSRPVLRKRGRMDPEAHAGVNTTRRATHMHRRTAPTQRLEIIGCRT